MRDPTNRPYLTHLSPDLLGHMATCGNCSVRNTTAALLDLALLIDWQMRRLQGDAIRQEYLKEMFADLQRAVTTYSMMEPEQITESLKEAIEAEASVDQINDLLDGAGFGQKMALVRMDSLMLGNDQGLPPEIAALVRKVAGGLVGPDGESPKTLKFGRIPRTSEPAPDDPSEALRRKMQGGDHAEGT